MFEAASGLILPVRQNFGGQRRIRLLRPRGLLGLRSLTSLRCRPLIAASSSLFARRSLVSNPLASQPIKFTWWAEKDSNLRRREPSDLQSDPFGHSGICPHRRKLTHKQYSFCQLTVNFIAYGTFSSISPAIKPISPLSFAAKSPAKP